MLDYPVTLIIVLHGWLRFGVSDGEGCWPTEITPNFPFLQREITFRISAKIMVHDPVL